MTLGTDKKGLKPLPVVTLGRLMPVLGLAAVLGPLAVQAQGTAAPTVGRSIDLPARLRTS